MNQPQKFDIEEMQKLHQNLEEQFLSFNKIIPYNHNPTNVYSPRLYNMLQDACAQVNSMMHHLAFQLKLYTNIKQKHFPFYYQLLNSQGMLSMQKVCPKQDIKKKMMPFKSNKLNAPTWWQQYNDTKHDLPKGAYCGTIGNVMSALGALTILHNITEQISKISQPKTLLDKRKWLQYPNDITNDMNRLQIKATVAYDSKIFFFLCLFLK